MHEEEAARRQRLQDLEEQLKAQGKDVTKCPPGIPRGYLTNEKFDNIIENTMRIACSGQGVFQMLCKKEEARKAHRKNVYDKYVYRSWGFFNGKKK